MPEETQTVFGLKACLALYRRRPEAVRRIFYRRERARSLSEMLSWAASRRIVYRELDGEGLHRVAKSAHHEGLVLVTEPLRYRTFAERQAGEHSGWVALDGVENPHNLGAIMRTCAFFGLDGVLVGGTAPGDKVNAAAVRVAEGGAEYLELCAVPALPPLLRRLAKKQWALLGLETGGEKLPGAEMAAPPWMLVAGHEAEGLTAATRRACIGVYAIPGSGRVGSLNVSVAVGVALAGLQGRT